MERNDEFSYFFLFLQYICISNQTNDSYLMTELDSKTIKALRFPLTFLVVLLHCMGRDQGMIHWDELTVNDFPLIVKYMLSGTLCQLAVPTFFFISGYLFFQKLSHWDLTVYRSKLKKRVSGLLVPYLLWNLLCVPITFLVMWGEVKSGSRTMESLTTFLHEAPWTHLFWDFSSHDSSFKTLWGGTILVSSPILGTFWYVRDLMVMIVLSPLIYYLFRWGRQWTFFLLVMVFLLRLWPYTSLSVQSLFFAFGAYWALDRRSLCLSSHRVVRWLCYVMTVVFWMLVIYYHGNDSYWGVQLMPFFTFTAMWTVFSLARQYVTHCPPHWSPSILLTESSFFVYALHIELALPLAFFLSKRLFGATTSPWLLTLQYLLLPVLIYAICLLCWQVLKKICPRGLSLLNGNR